MREKDSLTLRYLNGYRNVTKKDKKQAFNFNWTNLSIIYEINLK
ncbi:hypothetical protein [Paraclostridium sordellii]|nr:hypothetical protein [Paeniclostridium sordellii]